MSSFSGAPGRTRTCDARIRNPELYPPELRGHSGWIVKEGFVKKRENSYTNEQLFARGFSLLAAQVVEAVEVVH
jgi:hypothetical protein